MGKKLFGTDGIRGAANHYPMTPAMAVNIGIAAARYVKEQGCNGIIIGKDTRISGDMLESALAAGITSEGVDVFTAGVVPTPGVAFLLSDHNEAETLFNNTADIGNNIGGPENNISGSNIENRTIGDDNIENCNIANRNIGAGIVISASHNPWEDNGIKLFKKGGWKLADEEEEHIESIIFSISSYSPLSNTDSNNIINEIGRIYPITDALDRYCSFLKKDFCIKYCSKAQEFNSSKLYKNRALKIVVDCSNGAASRAAQILFADNNKSSSANISGINPNLSKIFDVQFIFNSPDGKNINHNCGSQHTETLASKVIESKADIGLAFDGDADRLIAVDETGEVITGDRILAICAAYLKEKGGLENNSVVTTIMSNIGLLRTLKDLAVDHIITGVGDREVLKKMIDSGAVIGGEDSGHMIFLKHHNTGDGLLTALRLIEVMIEKQKSLSELASIMKVYPQILMNIKVDASRPDFMAVKPIADEIKAVEAELGADGRVLVRYSGTQPLLRVMVEGPEYNKTKEFCERICNKIKEFQI